MASYVQLPAYQYPQNALLDFSPINNAGPSCNAHHNPESGDVRGRLYRSEGRRFLAIDGGRAPPRPFRFLDFLIEMTLADLQAGELEPQRGSTP